MRRLVSWELKGYRRGAGNWKSHGLSALTQVLGLYVVGAGCDAQYTAQQRELHSLKSLKEMNHNSL